MTNPSFSNSRACRTDNPSVSKFSNSRCTVLSTSNTKVPAVHGFRQRIAGTLFYYTLLFQAMPVIRLTGYTQDVRFIARLRNGCSVYRVLRPFHCQITEQLLSLSCPAGSSGPGAFLRAPWGTHSHRWESPRQPARTPCSPAPLSQHCPVFWDR